MKTILAMLFATAVSCAAAQDTSVVKLEYFIDADPGVGNAASVNITPSGDVTFPFTIDLTGYSRGYHKLYIRTKDNLGRWSLAARRNIEVLPLQAKNNVTGGEYFIDEDPGYGAAFAITLSTPDTAVLQDFNAVVAGLTEGYHKLYGRVKDTDGHWSQTFRRNIEVIKNENNKVINGEYFFKTDNGFDACTPVAFSTPSADGTFSFNIAGGQVPADADTLFLRVRDDIESRWSLTHWTGINRTLPLTLLGFNGVRQLNAVELQWQTTNEINTHYFNIQRSTDALNFITVGTVNAKNNRTAVNDYSYPDNIAGLSAKNIYYRLELVDIDAKSQFSKIVKISVDDIKAGFSITPNPAKDFINIITLIPGDLNGAVLTIADMAGHVTLKHSLSARDKQQVDVSSLAKGMYIVTIVKPTRIESKKLLLE